MTELSPKLLIDDPLSRALTGRRTQPHAVVLVLHGGRETSREPIRAAQLPVLRMVPFARTVARLSQGQVVVARLRYRVRGWNASTGQLPDPVADTRWALAQLDERFGDLPIAIIGHSMGGRTAMRVGGHPRVRALVGLASWLPSSEPVAQLAGRQVLLVHGSADRMTDPTGSGAFAERLPAAGATATLVTIRGERHAMLRRPRLWHRLAAQFALAAVLPGYHPAPAAQPRPGHLPAPAALPMPGSQPSDSQGAPNLSGQLPGGIARITY